MRKVLVFLILMMVAAGPGAVADSTGAAEIVSRVMAVRRAQMAGIDDITFDVEAYETSLDGSGNVKETKKYSKKIFMKKAVGDNFKYWEEYLAYYINGIRQEKADLKKLAAEKAEKKKKRGGKDISYDMTLPLKAASRNLYVLTYEGLSPQPVDGYVCYLVRATADSSRVPNDIMDTLINCLYYIDTVSYQIVQIDFAPAKLVSKFLFKMSALDMRINYEPYGDSLWLPYRFHIRGKARAIYAVGINFEAEEQYNNPVINAGLEESMFKD